MKTACQRASRDDLADSVADGRAVTAVLFAQPDVPRFVKSGALISDTGLGDALAEALGTSASVLIPGHGLVTVGTSVAEAVMRAVLLNRACATQLSAMAAGGPVRWSSDEEVRLKAGTAAAPGMLQSGYDYLVRSAGG